MAVLGNAFFTTRIETNIPEVLDRRARSLVTATKIVLKGRLAALNTSASRIVRAGLGARVSKAFGREIVETPTGIDATLFSKARTARAPDGSTYDLFYIFQYGEELRAKSRVFMALPLPAAGKGPGGRKARVSDYPADALMAKIKGDHGVLVLRTDPDRALFVLVARAHRYPRLNFDRVRALANQDLTPRILREWAKGSATVALKLVA